MLDPFVKFTIVYPDNAMIVKQMRHEDMEYLRYRILTDRSERKPMVSVDTSRFYEGAKTLVDLLEYTDTTGHVLKLKTVDVIVDINGRGHSEICASAVCQSSFLKIHKLTIDPELVIKYSYDGPDGENKFGTYSIGVSITNSNITKTTHFADVLSGEILKYSQNFKSPSVFADDIQKSIIGAIRDFSKE